MEQIAIGNSGPITSHIGLGTWAIGGWMWGGTDETKSIATIRSAVARGVTLIDTAPAYGFGGSEDIVGKALAKGGLRDKVQIANASHTEILTVPPVGPAPPMQGQGMATDRAQRIIAAFRELGGRLWPGARDRADRSADHRPLLKKYAVGLLARERAVAEG
jgi:hypothetical protein